MKKIKNFMLALFSLMLIVVPVALAGCGSQIAEIKDNAYYYNLDETVNYYQVVKHDKNDGVVLIYNVPGQNVESMDDVIEMIENSEYEALSVEYTCEIVDNVTIYTFVAGNETGILTPSKDSKSIELKFVGQEDGEETSRVINFTIYEA